MVERLRRERLGKEKLERTKEKLENERLGRYLREKETMKGEICDTYRKL